MKRKRGTAKMKPKSVPVDRGVDELIQNITSIIAQEEWNLRATPQRSCRSEQNAGSRDKRVVDSNMRITRNSFSEMDAVASTNLSKRGKGKIGSSSKGFSSSNMKQSRDSEKVQNGGILPKEPNFANQNSQHHEQDVKSALEVIRKVMKIDVAEPFNVPVDPVALNAPDYFDVIDTPMDFGTICKHIENGVKYKTSKDVWEDVQQIWGNCSKYNKKGHYILEIMKRAKKNFTKLWREAGLHREQLENKPTLAHNTHEHRGPLAALADCARNLQQDEDLDRIDQQQASTSETQSYQPQVRPSQCELRPGQQQSDNTIADSAVRLSPNGYRRMVDPLDYNPTRPQQMQSQYCLQRHQSSTRYSKLYQPHRNSWQGHPSLQPPRHFYRDDAAFIRIAGHSYIPPPFGQSSHGYGYRTGSWADYQNCAEQWPSVSYSQLYQPERGSYRCTPSSGQQQSSHPFADYDNADAEDIYSPYPKEPETRWTKLGASSSMGPTNDCTSNQQQDQMAPRKLQSHQLSSHAQEHQPILETSKAQSSSSELLSSSDEPLGDAELDTSEEEFHYPVESMDRISPSYEQHLSIPQAPTDVNRTAKTCSTNIQKKNRVRGPTRCLDVWNSDEKIYIPTNEFGQAIGPNASKFTNFLGTIARNGHIAPLNYIEWRVLPDENKEKMWQLVQWKFDIDPMSKTWVMKSINNKWKDWKCYLKTNHYDPHETEEEWLADCDERVLPDQWQTLLSYWNSTEAKLLSMKNKIIRSQNKYNHTMGSKSFARLRKEQRAKRPDQKEPSRADLFILSRTRKDGQPVNEDSSAVISQLREAAQRQETSQSSSVEDEAFVKVMGKDRPGHVRTFGLGPTPSDLNGSRCFPGETVRLVRDSNAEVREMKEKMSTMEQTCAQMASQMANMVSMMENLQKSVKKSRKD